MKSKLQKKIEERIADLQKSNEEQRAHRKHHCDNIIAQGANGRDLAKYIDRLKDVHAMEFENTIRIYELQFILE